MEGRQCKCQTQAVVASPSSPPWIELPRDITADILQRLGAEQLLCSAQHVCSSWWRICKDPAFWRVLVFSNPNLGNSVDLMLRRTLHRSQGQLIDLTVHFFDCAKLLIHIAARAPNLRRLKLGVRFSISVYHAAIFATLSNLEELHLTLDRAVHIRAIGYACPTLKSFSLNTFNCKFVLLEGADDDIISFYRNLCARAIAASMPNLQHLQLFAHWIGNEGLQGILDACPRLESLDVRRCFDLHLEGDLGKRCHQRMKHLKLPHDSVSDVPWPNWDGRDPFGPDAYFDDYEYNYYQDGEDYFPSEEDEDDEDVLNEEDEEDDEDF